MKYMICVLLTLLSFSLLAVVRTVDNNNPSAGQYTTIQAAIDASNNDDIIYVYPSNTAYAGFTVNRRLKIYGVGWQATTVNIRRTMLSSTVQFQAGSEHSELHGFANGFSVWMNGVVGNIQITNCSLSYLHFENSSISANATNYTIMDCYFNGAGYSGDWIRHQNAQTGLLISNCVFVGSARLMWYATSNVTVLNSYISTTTPTFFTHGSNPNIRNNYIIAPAYASNGGLNTFPSDAVIAYNMSSTALFPTGTTNQNNIPLSSVFDSLFHPIPGSPAINAGDPAADYNDLDGSRNDIGVFGGPFPYDDNGFTTLPTITDISGTLYTSPSQGLQIHVEASSRH